VPCLSAAIASLMTWFAGKAEADEEEECLLNY
jgi:hypothetical protein